jgi:hypothetical protein
VSSLADIVGRDTVSLDSQMKPDYARENWHWRKGSQGAGPAVIFDIDGVLADAAGRQHYLDWGDWKRFFDACGDDPIIEEIERLLELLDSSLKVVLLTGRPRRVLPHTVGWLERYGLRWDVLIMREYGDYSGVDEFKRGALRDLVQEGFDIRLALDDDPKNHAMYVSEGVPCIYIHSGYYL